MIKLLYFLIKLNFINILNDQNPSYVKHLWFKLFKGCFFLLNIHQKQGATLIATVYYVTTKSCFFFVLKCYYLVLVVLKTVLLFNQVECSLECRYIIYNVTLVKKHNTVCLKNGFFNVYKCFRVLFSLKKQTIKFLFTFSLYFPQKATKLSSFHLLMKTSV